MSIPSRPSRPLTLWGPAFHLRWPGLDPPNLLLPVSQGHSVLSPQILSTTKSGLTQSLTGDGGCWLAGEAGEG